MLRMVLNGWEVANATGRVHLAHETVTYLRCETRTELIFPVLERPRRGDLKAVEERPVDRHLIRRQMIEIDIDPASGEPHGGALDDDSLARDLGFDDRESLSERMVGEFRRRIRPEQIGEVVPRELLARFQSETDQERQVLARAEPHLLAGGGEQGGSTQAVQHERMSHIPACVLLIRSTDKACEST